jgi:hypothetical protein
MSKYFAGLVISMLLFCVSARCQDRIYKTNGDVLTVKVKNVGANNITYYYRDNLNGPDYTIAKSEVIKIVYKNGSQDEFNTQPNNIALVEKAKPEGDFSNQIRNNPHLLTFSMFQFTENGVGFGLGYEKILEKRGYFAFTLPFVSVFNLSSQDQVNHGYSDPMFYIMPGFKYYTNSCFGNSSFAFGPNFVLAAGSKTRSTTNYSSTYPYVSSTTYNVTDHDLFGIIFNCSGNFNAGGRIVLGLEFGAGFNYINEIGGVNQGLSGLVQGGFKMGFRY